MGDRGKQTTGHSMARRALAEKSKNSFIEASGTCKLNPGVDLALAAKKRGLVAWAI